MSRTSIEDKLRHVGVRLRHARDELAVLEEQLVVFRDTADETTLQALVDESPSSASEHRDAQRHADAMMRTREKLLASIAELERSRDDLLDRLVDAR
jgi:hypothetical protein